MNAVAALRTPADLRAYIDQMFTPAEQRRAREFAQTDDGRDVIEHYRQETRDEAAPANC